MSDFPHLTGTFHPLQGSRRGEAYAWALTGVMAVVAIVVGIQAHQVPWFVWLLLGFFLGSALLTTFGHWVDSRTQLTLSENEVEFNNGLRHVRLAWPQIQAIRIQEDRWGKRVQVEGKDGQHFAFRTIVTVEIHEGQPQNLFGFQEGEQITATMINRAGLEAAADGSTYTRV